MTPRIKGSHLSNSRIFIALIKMRTFFSSLDPGHQQHTSSLRQVCDGTKQRLCVGKYFYGAKQTRDDAWGKKTRIQMPMAARKVCVLSFKIYFWNTSLNRNGRWDLWADNKNWGIEFLQAVDEEFASLATMLLVDELLGLSEKWLSKLIDRHAVGKNESGSFLLWTFVGCDAIHTFYDQWDGVVCDLGAGGLQHGLLAPFRQQ